MKHIENNLVPVSIFVLAVVSFRLAGASGRYLAAEIYIRSARNTLFTLALTLPITCGMGINFVIVVGATSVQMAMVFSVDPRLGGAMALMSATGVSIVLSVLFGTMVVTPLNRVRGREIIVSIMIGQLSSVIYQFTFMVAYGLLIQPRNRDILLDRGTGVRSMVDARNISSVFRGMLPFRFDGKTYSLLPLIIILFSGLVLFYTQKTRLGTLARVVGTDGETADTLGIAGNWVCSICIATSAIFAAMSQILFVADSRTINVCTGYPGLSTFAAVTILVGGASVKEVRARSYFIDVILLHTLFITSPMVGQNLSHNPPVGKYFRSFLAYGAIATVIIMNLRNEGTKVQGI